MLMCNVLSETAIATFNLFIIFQIWNVRRTYMSENPAKRITTLLAAKFKSRYLVSTISLVGQ